MSDNKSTVKLSSSSFSQLHFSDVFINVNEQMLAKQVRNSRAVGFLLYPFFCLIIENMFSSGSWFNLPVNKKKNFSVR